VLPDGVQLVVIVRPVFDVNQLLVPPPAVHVYGAAKLVLMGASVATAATNASHPDRAKVSFMRSVFQWVRNVWNQGNKGFREPAVPESQVDRP
jgi:hypothetical protein